MSDIQERPVDVLDGFIKSLGDTKTGIQGLVEKLSAIQLEATEKGFDDVSAALGKPFGAASRCAEELEAVIHDAELERNRLANEAP